MTTDPDPGQIYHKKRKQTEHIGETKIFLNRKLVSINNFLKTANFRNSDNFSVNIGKKTKNKKSWKDPKANRKTDERKVESDDR